MKSSKLLFCLTLTCGICYAHAQQAEGSGRKNLALSVWVSDNISELTPEAQNSLQNKLTQIASKQGVATASGYSRFIITANVVVQEKYLTSTAPPKHACKLDITFYVGDGLEGKVFASHTSSVAGIGDNESKAYMNALKNIKVLDPAYKKLMDLGTSKILDYFNNRCDAVIREAKTLANSQKYEEALWKLTSVPDICTSCRSKAMDEADAIFQQKIDRECKIMLAEATNVWNAGQNLETSEKAGALLVNIDPASSCYPQALALSEQIAKRVKELDERNETAKKEELDFQRKMKEKNVEVEKDRIKAYRDVGVAWAENQPRATYVSFW
ncbi:MAG: hypothetical protein LBH84_05190 [Prevotellaceae bacterium]|jgi:hypothetical protein|nr:hypothetical protein [Prevotellaceae bacterium]